MKKASNSKTIEAIVLGSGTCIPNPLRRPPAFLVKSEKHKILIDCGSGCTTSLSAWDVSLDDLSAVLITHFHLDHVSEIPALLFAFRNAHRLKRKKPLYFFGPKGLKKRFEDLFNCYGKWVQPQKVPIVIKEISDNQKFSIGPFNIFAHSVLHIEPSFAYRIVSGKKIIVFSGDSAFCEQLVLAARKADLFFCECARLEKEDCMHLSAKDAGKIAEAARCKRLVLTHLYPHVVKMNPVKTAAKHFFGKILLAEDGMRFISRFE